MSYVYIANAPQDNPFVNRLSADLEHANIPHWYDDGQAAEETVYQHLQQATHVIAVLSPAMMLNERVLAALEYARDQRLERLALRLTPLENLPPQIQGVLPLDFSGENNYSTMLETLLEDLSIEPPPQLPEEIVSGLYSSNATVRQNAIEALAVFYRDADDDLKEQAKDELQALVFRERDPRLKTLVHTRLQAIDLGVRPPEKEIALPSKEELAVQAGDRAVIVGASQALYFWKSRRWYVVWIVLSLFLGAVMAAVGGHWSYALPVLAVGLCIPAFNVMIRQGGEFEWNATGSVFGNMVLSLIVAIIPLPILMIVLNDLSLAAFVLSLLVAVGLGGLIGWLASVKIPA